MEKVIINFRKITTDSTEILPRRWCNSQNNCHYMFNIFYLTLVKSTIVEFLKRGIERCKTSSN